MQIIVKKKDNINAKRSKVFRNGVRLFTNREFSESSINELWENSLNDNRYLYNVNKYNDI